MGAVDTARAAEAIDTFLRALGHDAATNPELVGTGARVASAFADDLLAGYREDPAEILRREALTTTLAQPTIVQLAPVRVAPMCPHHLLPAEGIAEVAFAGRRLVGVGALAAATRAASRRLVLQEALGEALADAIAATVEPVWVFVGLRLRHGCMTLRGERASESAVTTIATRGPVPEGRVASFLGGSL